MSSFRNAWTWFIFKTKLVFVGVHDRYAHRVLIKRAIFTWILSLEPGGQSVGHMTSLTHVSRLISVCIAVFLQRTIGDFTCEASYPGKQFLYSN